MKRLLENQTKGQSLVMLVFLTAVLFGFLAFSVDMGHIYYMRRWSQNAADAGALAAARQICVYQDQDIAENSARVYIEGDGTNQFKLPSSVKSQTMTDIDFGPDASLGLVEGEVKVDVAIEHATFAANFFGLNTFTELATATAACLGPGGAVGAGVIPVAWECRNVETYGDCRLEYVSPDNECKVLEDYMYVFFDSNTIYWCEEWADDPDDPEDDPPDGAVMVTCDAHGNDGVADIEILNPLYPHHKWFWINIGGGGCTALELKDIIENGLSIPMYTHEWYPECEGVIDVVYHYMLDFREGDDVVVPVFYPTCEATNPLYEAYAAACTPHEQDVLCKQYDGTVCNDENAGTSWFHLSDFELFHLSCVTDNPNQDCQDDSLHARAWLEANNVDIDGNTVFGNENSFEGCFISGYDPGLIGTPGSGSEAWTISLTR